MRSKEKYSSAVSISEFLAEMKGLHFNPEEESYEQIITREIHAEDLKHLLLLPYEITIIEHAGNLILKTSGKDGGPAAECFYQNEKKSRVFLHTHPLNDEPPMDTPSFQDARPIAHPSTPLLLAHANGITLFQHPICDPRNGKPLEHDDDAIKNTVRMFLHAKRITLFKEDRGGKSYFPQLDKNRQIALQREFAEKSGMILKEAVWDDDEKKLKPLLDILNLRSKMEVVSGLRSACRRRLFINSNRDQ